MLESSAVLDRTREGGSSLKTDSLDLGILVAYLSAISLGQHPQTEEQEEIQRQAVGEIALDYTPDIHSRIDERISTHTGNGLGEKGTAIIRNIVKKIVGERLANEFAGQKEQYRNLVQRLIDGYEEGVRLSYNEGVILLSSVWRDRAYLLRVISEKDKKRELNKVNGELNKVFSGWSCLNNPHSSSYGVFDREITKTATYFTNGSFIYTTKSREPWNLSSLPRVIQGAAELLKKVDALWYDKPSYAPRS